MQVEKTSGEEARGKGQGREREETRRAAEEEDEAADAVLNHVIVERFNWSGARFTLRWREDEINQVERWDTGGTSGDQGGG